MNTEIMMIHQLELKEICMEFLYKIKILVSQYM